MDIKKRKEVADTNNKLNQAEKFIEKWFNDTISRFETEIKSDRPVDHLCVTTLTVSVKYCEAILILLSNDCRMPAKALLRVLFELASKLAWCLRVPDDEMEAASEIVGEKIQRWSKSTAIQKIRILKGFKECIQGNKAFKVDNLLKRWEKLHESLDCQNMPYFVNMLKELPEPWATEFYTRCYLKFNDAVHLDVSSLGDRVEEDGNKFSVGYDSREDIKDLVQYCAVFEKMVFYLVRKNYEWDTVNLQNDFKGLSR